MAYSGAIHLESGSLRLSDGRLFRNVAVLGANTASHASGGGISIGQTGTAILFGTQCDGNRAFGKVLHESVEVLATQSKFWRDRRAAHVDCLGKLVLQRCNFSDSSEFLPQSGGATTWIVAQRAASVLLADCALYSSTLGTSMLRVFDAAEVAVRGCRAANLTVEQDGLASKRIGVVNSTFSPPLDSGLRLLGPFDETCGVPISVEATKAVWNDTEGRLCDPRATCTPGPSGGVQCTCRGEVSEGNDRGDGSQCFRPLSVATALATRTVTMKLTKPTLVNESLQVSVQADGEAKFTGAYTARSVLVRRNGDRADFPSEQVLGLSRDSVTVPLDAKAGVFTSRLLTEFTVRLDCARDAPALCPADGDTIETNITFTSTTDASVHDTALLRSEVEAIPSCSWTRVWLTQEGGALLHNAPDLAVTVTLADVDGLPINYTDPVGLLVTWTGPGAPGGAAAVLALARTEARSNVQRSRIPREYRSIPGRHN